MDTQNTSHIRNFSIVAHIDHGKSTISDRILELTNTVDERDMEAQLLDSMDIERERGITIKSNAVRVDYTADDGETYQFNLIDTPGHVDFTYEVSRSLAACEGAVLVVDATQGVEAQTVSNASLAMNADLDIVPAINKIDLPSAHPDEVKTEIEDELAIPADDAVCVSGKTGEGIHDLLEAIVFLISPPKGDLQAPLKALILDSYFDEYRGVVATVRVFDGSISKGDQLVMMQADVPFMVDGVGVKCPAEVPVDSLSVGEVGFVVTGLKDPEAVHVGDTLTARDRSCDAPLPGYREAKPMVYTGIFPIDNKDYENLRDALEKLHVNDPSLIWEPETSVALGFGFRVGFLGLLHMEVVKERLEREFALELIATSPSVDYHVFKTDQNRSKAHRGLVEHEKLGVAHKSAAHGEHLLLTARKRARNLATALFQARELLVDALEAGVDGALGLRIGAHLEVFLHRHLKKDATSLGYLSQALGNELVGGRMGDVLALEFDGPRLGTQQARNGLKSRGLTCTVSANQSHNLVFVDLKGNVLDGVDCAVPDVGVVYGKHRFCHGATPPSSCPNRPR